MSNGREKGGRAELPESGPELSLIQYMALFWRYRWMIIAVCVGGVALTFGYTITQPKIYESTATLVAPKEGPGSNLFNVGVASGVLQQIPGVTVPSLTPNRDLLVSVLKSRTITQGVVEHFGLQEHYEARYLQDAIVRLYKATNIWVSKEGAISVRVRDTDRMLAAEIANLYVEQLDRLVARYGTGEAGRQRGFLSEQLARAKVRLDDEEEALRRFQEQNRAVVLQEQTRGAIEAAARLKGEIMAVEVQLQVVRNFATEANPDIIALRHRIDEMRRQLSQLQYGDAVNIQPAGRRELRDFAVPFSRVPEVGLELARLSREVKIHETLVTLLSQQLEQTKIAEARDIPVVQVLDWAVAAERYSWPLPGLNVAVGGVVSLALSLVLVFLVESGAIAGRYRHQAGGVRHDGS